MGGGTNATSGNFLHFRQAKLREFSYIRGRFLEDGAVPPPLPPHDDDPQIHKILSTYFMDAPKATTFIRLNVCIVLVRENFKESFKKEKTLYDYFLHKMLVTGST